MTRHVLVVAAHSDDEALGCGGTIARHVRDGDAVHLMFLTDGVGARASSDGTEAGTRGSARDRAAEILGVTSLTQLTFPDNQLDTVALLEVTQAIEAAAAELAPEIVYTHHAGDLNIDHELCNRAVLTAFRPSPGQPVRAIYGFEVASATGWRFGDAPAFEPQHYVDISATLETKIRALVAYGEEMRPAPHVRSYEAVEALARWRGASVGLAAAEAFTVLRQIS